MNPDVKTLWLAALRSGEYQQGTGYLQYDGKFCCLGVLCELMPDIHKEPGAWEGTIRYGIEGGGCSYLPSEVMEWAGFDSSNPRVAFGERARVSLADLNDDEHLTFEQIADVVEAQL